MTIRRIGFVGVGNMGWPMAANLARAGFDVSIYDARAERAHALALACGAQAAPSLPALAQQAECVITMLPDHRAVHAVVLGAEGLAAALAPGTIVADMGTSDPTATRALGAALAARRIRLVDAPVMGGVPFAHDASLDIMAAGDADAIAALDPVFAVLGRKVYRCGALGNGHALKAINNYVNACTLANLVEALTIGTKLGLDAGLMIETMRAMCTGRNHPLEKKIVPHVVSHRYASGMALGFIAKDLGIAVDAAHAVQAAAPLAEKVLALWQAAAAELGAERDQTEIARYWERASGVQL